MGTKLRVANILNDIYKWLLLNKHLKIIFNEFSIDYRFMWISWFRISLFFSKKSFDIIGVDNNARKFFFGKDGDISWIKLKLKKNIKNYQPL